MFSTDCIYLATGSAFDVRRPVGRVDLRGVFEKLHHVVKLLLVQVKVGHLASSGGAGRLGLDPGLDECRAASLVHIAELRRKICTFAHQGVATDAIARFPNVLAAKDRLSQVLAVVTLGKRAHGIERQSDQHQEEEHSTAVEDIPGG